MNPLCIYLWFSLDLSSIECTKTQVVAIREVMLCNPVSLVGCEHDQRNSRPSVRWQNVQRQVGQVQTVLIPMGRMG